MSIYTEILEREEIASGDETCGRLAEELRACLLPVAEVLGCSLAVGTDGSAGPERLRVDRDCRCGGPRRGASPTEPCRPDRTKAVLPVVREGVYVGYVEICPAPGGAGALAEAARGVVDVVVQKCSLERQETLLLTELGSCWENLEALYDVHALPPGCRSLDAMIDWILERVVEGNAGLFAQLWLEVDGHVLPRTFRGDGGLAARSGLAGIVGRAVVEQRAVVLDAPSEEGDAPCGFARLLAAPAATRHGTRGALLILDVEGGRPFDSRVVRHARALAAQAVLAAEGELLHRAALENELVRQEMEIGSKMQQLLLLGDKPDALAFAEVSSLAIQSEALGGDFLEFFHLSPSRLDVLIGDVMGKGLKASLIGAAITRQFHRTLCSLMSADSNCRPAPETIVSSVHEGVARRLSEFESFATLDYARFDALRRRLDFVDCGHPPILHYRRAAAAVRRSFGRNVPLGFSDYETYEQVSVPYEDGDVFVFYSDGVTETRDADGELFGLERLIELTESLAGTGRPEDLTQAIRAALVKFAGADRVDDDLTLAVVRVRNLKRSEPVMGKTIEIANDLDRLEDCRSLVRDICREEGGTVLDEDQIGLLELAVTEVASNIMVHAQGGDPTGIIRVKGEVSDESVLVRFDYAGEPFDPADVPSPAFDGTEEHGYGVYLTSLCVDHVNYNCRDDGLSFIVMIKNRT